MAKGSFATWTSTGRGSLHSRTRHFYCHLCCYSPSYSSDYSLTFRILFGLCPRWPYDPERYSFFVQPSQHHQTRPLPPLVVSSKLLRGSSSTPSSLDRLRSLPTYNRPWRRSCHPQDIRLPTGVRRSS